MGVLIQTFGEDEALPAVLAGVTLIVPVVVTVPHPPVNVMVYVNGPATVGVPLMVTTFEAHTPVTPDGRPLKVAPVAIVVLYAMLVMAELMHLVWALVPAADESVMVLFAVTFMVPVAFIFPHPPVKGMM